MPFDVTISGALEKALKEEYQRVLDDEEVLVKPRSPQDLVRLYAERGILEERQRR